MLLLGEISCEIFQIFPGGYWEASLTSADPTGSRRTIRDPVGRMADIRPLSW